MTYQFRHQLEIPCQVQKRFFPLKPDRPNSDVVTGFNIRRIESVILNFSIASWRTRDGPLRGPNSGISITLEKYWQLFHASFICCQVVKCRRLVCSSVVSNFCLSQWTCLLRIIIKRYSSTCRTGLPFMVHNQSTSSRFYFTLFYFIFAFPPTTHSTPRASDFLNFFLVEAFYLIILSLILERLAALVGASVSQWE